MPEMSSVWFCNLIVIWMAAADTQIHISGIPSVFYGTIEIGDSLSLLVM
jgi:hypothetical protein